GFQSAIQVGSFELILKFPLSKRLIEARRRRAFDTARSQIRMKVLATASAALQTAIQALCQTRAMQKVVYLQIVRTNTQRPSHHLAASKIRIRSIVVRRTMIGHSRLKKSR